MSAFHYKKLFNLDFIDVKTYMLTCERRMAQENKKWKKKTFGLPLYNVPRNLQRIKFYWAQPTFHWKGRVVKTMCVRMISRIQPSFFSPDTLLKQDTFCSSSYCRLESWTAALKVSELNWPISRSAVNFRAWSLVTRWMFWLSEYPCQTERKSCEFYLPGWQD